MSQLTNQGLWGRLGCVGGYILAPQRKPDLQGVCGGV